MKYIITIETDDHEERLAILMAMENKIKLDNIYSEVFRKHIKYEDDQSTTWDLVWEELSQYLEE
jgi:hypothetical protein